MVTSFFGLSFNDEVKSIFNDIVSEKTGTEKKEEESWTSMFSWSNFKKKILVGALGFGMIAEGVADDYQGWFASGKKVANTVIESGENLLDGAVDGITDLVGGEEGNDKKDKIEEKEKKEPYIKKIEEIEIAPEDKKLTHYKIGKYILKEMGGENFD